MRSIHAIMFFLGFGLLLSCSKKDDLSGVEDIPGLGGDTWAQGPIDKWINDTLTTPFNIAVKYKWDQFEYQLDKTLVPVKEEKVVPVMSSVKQVWIDTYIAEAGSTFFKKYTPKFFVLYGSASWNTNGTITLGEAEGGRKITLFVINEFRTKGMAGYVPSDSLNIKQMFHTIEHEFGHILHQTIKYPVEFTRVTAGLYSGNWNNISDADARQDGFVTAYAEAGFDEDFVEMISVMLTEGRSGFDNIVNSIPAGTSINGTTQAQAQASLRLKESIVVNYYKTVWNIDFYNLQTRTRAAIVRLIQ